MTSYSRIARAGIFWSYLRQAIAWGLQIPTAIILARLLSPTDFGIAAASSFFVMLSARLTRAGLNTALIRIKTMRPEHASTVFVFNIIMSATICLLLVASAAQIGAYFRSTAIEQAVRLASASFVISAFATVPMALLRRDMRFREVATVQSVALTTESVLAVILAFLGFGFWSIVYGQLAGTFAQTVTVMAFARWTPSVRWSRRAWRELFPIGSGTYMLRLLEYGAQNIDNLIVGRLLGVTALGFYDKAYRTMLQMVSRLNAAGPGVSFRIFALIHEEPERFRRAYRKVLLTVTLIAYPALAGLLAVAPEFFPFVFGPQWVPAVVPFQILCVAGMLKVLNEYADSALQAAGWVWSEVWCQTAYLILTIGGVALLSRWGLSGAALAVLIATSIMFGMLQRLMRVATNISWRDMLEPQRPGAMCAAGILLLVPLTRASAGRAVGDLPDGVLLLAEVTVCAPFYLGFLWYSRFPEVRSLVRETLSDFAPGLAKAVKPLV